MIFKELRRKSKKHLNKFLTIGQLKFDSEDLLLKKSSLLIMTFVISISALLWGGIYIFFERYLSASIPLFYSFISFISINYFSKTKNIIPLCITQLLLILFLPFFLMWSLGGFAASSFVIIWSFYAPIGALIYLGTREALKWFACFFFLIIISSIIDQYLISISMPIMAIEIFFILNISVGLLGIFFIIQHYIKTKEKSADVLLQMKHNALLKSAEKLRKSNAKLESLSRYDPLTLLFNRRHLSEKLEEFIGIANGQQFSVFFLDLDRFKHINDTYGHSIGDLVLIAASARLKKIIEAGCVLSRFGGDEFVIITRYGDLNNTQVFAKRILNVFSEPFEIENLVLYITASIGIALYPEHGKTPTILIKNADTAMYLSKREGRNNFSYYSELLSIDILNRMKIESMLRNALERNELSLRFQIQVDTLHQKIYGIEVLLRWKQADTGFISPTKFIPIAEDSGQIYTIGKWVLEQSCQFMQCLLSEGFEISHISINVSGNQFLNDMFITDVTKILKQTKLQGKHLELEITESIIMSNKSKAIKVLHTLSNMGVSLSIDDFGTGYSSLSYLKKLPIKSIKIDRSFISDFHDDDKEITKAIIALGTALNLNIIAEGVERREQLDFLAAQGCILIQGYFFSKPINAEDLIILLKKPQSVLNLAPL